MNSISRDRQWQIDRYLLDDPTLDRETFEQQMLADVSLAEQVAASVVNLQDLKIAAASAATSTVAIAPSTDDSVHGSRIPVWATLATVAALLLGIICWHQAPSPTDVKSSAEISANEVQLSQMAEHWLAFDNQFSVHQEEEFLPDLDPGFRRHEQTELELINQTDWLVEAAREFYQESSGGTQG